MNCLHRYRRNASGSATASVLFLLESSIWHQHTTLTNIDSMILITFRRLTDSEKLKTIKTRQSISRFDRVKNSTLSQTDGQTHTARVPSLPGIPIEAEKKKKNYKLYFTLDQLLFLLNYNIQRIRIKHFYLMDWNSTWRASAAYRRTGRDRGSAS